MAFSRDARIPPEDVDEGDRVVMSMHSHNFRKYGSAILGEVIDAPREEYKKHIGEGELMMVDYAVEADDGTIWRWNVDNGYVIGPVDDPDRPSRSDIGKFEAFYEPDEVDLSTDREHGTLVE